MPIYVYRCPHGHKFERVVQVSKDEPLDTVPCNEGKCRKQFVIAELQAAQRGNFILKPGGVGGFYKPTRS